MCKLPEHYIDNDFKKTLTKLVKDIQIKHQNKRCEILHNFDGNLRRRREIFEIQDPKRPFLVLKTWRID